jgi:tetratricopeptide (TPR) repeat protein/predicted Ser/Thr protein kinase
MGRVNVIRCVTESTQKPALMQAHASDERLSKYELIRPLGAGGMGAVYLARDTRLRRDVAIKFVSPRSTDDPAANARLLHEARAAAKLDHPGICPVYDVEVDTLGRTCIVMQYVEGETLAVRLERGALAPDAAVALAAEIADALAAAHAQGIVHRDLKPQNVMVMPDGHPKLLDFGIAFTEVPAETSAELATQTATSAWAPGGLIGTPAYMSPEQVLLKPIDGRSDLFSLGAVVFECLTGQAAFLAASDIDTWARVVYVHPPAPSSLNPRVPAGADDVVARLLAKDPEQRYTTAAEAADALRAYRDGPPKKAAPRRQSRAVAIAAMLLVLVAAVVAVVGWPRWRGPAEPPPVRPPQAPVLAVLPLTNLSGDASADYVGAGMAETIATKLASLPAVAVVSRAEVHDALAKNTDVPKLCRALGVSYAVTGAVQRANGTLHVTINLLGPDGKTVVAEGGRIYDDTIDHLFTLQQRMAEDLSTLILGRLSVTERAQLARNPTANVEAMSAYWRGRALMERPGPDPIGPAIDAFNEAIALDGAFTLAHAGLGGAYWRKYEQTREPAWAAKAVDSTEKARQLNPDEPDVRLALATVYKGVGRVDDAVAEAEHVLQLQPASYEAHRLLGDIRATRGEIDLAIGECLAAVRIRPDYAAGYRSLGLLQMNAGRYDDAAASFERMSQLDLESPFPYQLLGNAHVYAGRIDVAERDFSQALKRGGSFATHSSLGTVYYLRGRFADAAKEYQAAIALRPKNATTHWNLGDAYRQLGRAADARAAYTDAVTLFDADLRVNPKDAGALATRATCLARLGQVARAEQDAQHAVALQPLDNDVQYQRALVALIARRPSEAMVAIEAAVAAGYSLPLLRLDQDLAPLRTDPRFVALVGTTDSPTRRAK